MSEFWKELKVLFKYCIVRFIQALFWFQTWVVSSFRRSLFILSLPILCSKPRSDSIIHLYFQISPDKYQSNSTHSRLRYQPSDDGDFGLIYCWASNSMGLMEPPCSYQLIPAGNKRMRKYCNHILRIYGRPACFLYQADPDIKFSSKSHSYHNVQVTLWSL